MEVYYKIQIKVRNDKGEVVRTWNYDEGWYENMSEEQIIDNTWLDMGWIPDEKRIWGENTKEVEYLDYRDFSADDELIKRYKEIYGNDVFVDCYKVTYNDDRVEYFFYYDLELIEVEKIYTDEELWEIECDRYYDYQKDAEMEARSKCA
ncbi:hypothetical protein OFO01_07250 [Campylobacter sp. JMF_01 NE2]|uniref:hypothetical protein n=1 Tax=unclassified Campylobacter TaxID=2593542 RepID=UPI0022E9A65D|nr:MULTISPECIES: hypothetical protein [unclassified Campylobacter]MDA3053240.1 hypothetical protein [Campylobacter sp. JMF_03 NE3]MDA3067577.1 hypothetical protein [Campylobacter sp. JMF_01 NE2]